jgi:hypothetical protein
VDNSTILLRRRGAACTAALAAFATAVGLAATSARGDSSVVRAADPFLAVQGVTPAVALATPVTAEPVLSQPLSLAATLDPPMALPAVYDPLVQPASSMAAAQATSSAFYPAPTYYGAAEYQLAQRPQIAMRQPASWISGPNLKSGVAFVLGDDIFEGQDVGWTVSGGFRQPLGPHFGERSFFELGGSYLSAYGETTRPIAGTVTTFDNMGNVISRVTEAGLFDSTLKEVKRGTIHVALGWYWGDVVDNRGDDPQLRFATRFGGRLGHIRGRFAEVATETPDADELFTYNYYGKADTTGGLFIGTEAILLARDLRIGSTAITLDGEFGNDWMEFGGWGRGSLGTASLMLGAMLSR